LLRLDNGHGGAGASWRRDLERVGLLLGEEDTQRADFLLDRSERRDERSESQLVLRHESTDVVDVLFLLVVVLCVVLYVLETHVENLECALDRVQLRQGEQLDLWRSLVGCRARTTKARRPSYTSLSRNTSTLLWLCNHNKTTSISHSQDMCISAHMR